MSGELYGFVKRRDYETSRYLVCKDGDQLNLATQVMLDRVYVSDKAEEIIAKVSACLFGDAIEMFNCTQDECHVSYGLDNYHHAMNDDALVQKAYSVLERLDGS